MVASYLIYAKLVVAQVARVVSSPGDMSPDLFICLFVYV